MAHPAAFWDRIAQKYAKQPIADMESYEHKLDISRRYFTPQSNVLEVGCGTGSTALLHAPNVNHILATDLSAKMIAIANEKAKQQQVENVTFKQTSMEDLKLDVPVDIVMAMSLLHLLENRQQMVNKIYDLLAPGGVFISSTVCISGAITLLKPIFPLGRMFGLLPYVEFLDKAELLNCIKVAGFTIDYQWQPEKGMSVFIVAKKPMN